MAVPNDINFPTSIDTTKLFSEPTNAAIFTLASTLTIGGLSVVVNEAITSINVPTFFGFSNGEIIYVTGKDEGTKTFTIDTRGHNTSSSIAEHASGSYMKQIMVADYISQLRKSVVAIETLLGAEPATVGTGTMRAFDTTHTHSGTTDGAAISFDDLTDTSAIDAATLNSQLPSYYATDADLTTAEKSFTETLDIMKGIAPLTGAAASLELGESSDAGTWKPVFPQLLFDDTTNEGRMWVFRAKKDMRTGGITLNLSYRLATTATSTTVKWGCQIACIGDGDTVTSKAFDTASLKTDSHASLTAGVQYHTTIAIAEADADGMAEGDWVCVLLYRDASDTATGDAILTTLALDYA